MSAADILPFVRAWVRNPLRVAAVAPSGPAVSSLMAQEITADTGPVLELGPGTGVFTRALLKRGVRQQDLTLVEYGSEFIPLLQRRFPGARVLWMDAAWLRRERLFDGAPVGVETIRSSRCTLLSHAKLARACRESTHVRNFGVRRNHAEQTARLPQ